MVQGHTMLVMQGHVDSGVDTSFKRSSLANQRHSTKRHRNHNLTKSSHTIMFWTLGSISGATAVAFGAFGAHGLKKKISDPSKIAAWNTAAHYQVRT
jgi:hypothetical protein